MRIEMRRGLNAVEVIVLLLLIVVAIAVVLPSFLRVGELERRVSCENNLRNIGKAVLAFAEMDKAFPADDDWFNGFEQEEPTRNRTFFTAIRPLLSHAKDEQLLMEPPGPNANLKQIAPMPLYLCPSRRGVRVGPRDDYGAPHHVAWFHLPGDPDWKERWYGVLGNLGPREAGQGLPARPDIAISEILEPVTIEILREKDGMANTILIFHKGVAFSDYGGKGPNDEGWPYLGNFWEHKRVPFHLRLDFDGTWNEWAPSHLATSPHLDAMPVLFADGSVRPIAYTADPLNLARLCSWNDGDQ